MNARRTPPRQKGTGIAIESFIEAVKEKGAAAALPGVLLLGIEAGGEARAESLIEILKQSAQKEQFSLDVFSSDEISLADLLSIAENRPLFAPAQGILLRRAERLFERKEDREQILTYLNSSVEWTRLVLAASMSKEMEKIFDSPAVKGEGVGVIRAAAYSRDDLARRLARLAKEEGGGLKKEAAYALIERMGEDQSSLEQELKKLVLYKGEEPVSEEDVMDFVGELRDHDVWEILTAYENARSSEGMRLLRRVIRNESDAIQFVGLLAWRLRVLFDVAAHRETGADSGQISALLQNHRVFGQRQRGFLNIASRTSTQRLSRQFEALRHLSTEVKYARQKYGSGQVGENSHVTLPLERFLTIYSTSI